jgi:hypothetical protein
MHVAVLCTNTSLQLKAVTRSDQIRSEAQVAPCSIHRCAQNATLNGGSICNDLVGLDALHDQRHLQVGAGARAGAGPEVVSDELLNLGDPGRATDEDDLGITNVDVVSMQRRTYCTQFQLGLRFQYRPS